MFSGYLNQSILNKAIQRGLVKVNIYDLRNWSTDPHGKVDDRPFGGGPGMILMVEPVVQCVREIRERENGNRNEQLILLSPGGRRLDQPLIEQLAQFSTLTILCGRYEGFDQRVVEILKPLEVSIGDYVLSGGEVAAMVLIDCVVRMIPGVLGDELSNFDDSFSRGNRLLEYPQYTRPREFEGYCVPDVLLTGNHVAIEQWRRQKSLEKTAIRRSDLIDKNDIKLDKPKRDTNAE
jgi:tRNA (guanine37-N1)-methyltransferase